MPDREELLLNGDHLTEDEAAAPVLARLGRALNEREEQRRAPHGRAEDWKAWWQAVRTDPLPAEFVAERESRYVQPGHHGSPSGRLAEHVDALRAAGLPK